MGSEEVRAAPGSEILLPEDRDRGVLVRPVVVPVVGVRAVERVVGRIDGVRKDRVGEILGVVRRSELDGRVVVLEGLVRIDGVRKDRVGEILGVVRRSELDDRRLLLGRLVRIDGVREDRVGEILGVLRRTELEGRVVVRDWLVRIDGVREERVGEILGVLRRTELEGRLETEREGEGRDTDLDPEDRDTERRDCPETGSTASQQPRRAGTARAVTHLEPRSAGERDGRGGLLAGRRTRSKEIMAGSSAYSGQ